MTPPLTPCVAALGCAGTMDALLCCKQGTENVMLMLLEIYRWAQAADSIPWPQPAAGAGHPNTPHRRSRGLCAQQ